MLVTNALSEEYMRGMWYYHQRIAMDGVIVLTLKNEMPLSMKPNKPYLFCFLL